MQAASGRRMTGHEAVSCTLTAPNGTVHAVPVTLAEGGAHFQATLHWMQVGVHKVRGPRPPSTGNILLSAGGRSPSHNGPSCTAEEPSPDPRRPNPR